MVNTICFRFYLIRFLCVQLLGNSAVAPNSQRQSVDIQIFINSKENFKSTKTTNLFTNLKVFWRQKINSIGDNYSRTFYYSKTFIYILNYYLEWIIIIIITFIIIPIILKLFIIIPKWPIQSYLYSKLFWFTTRWNIFHNHSKSNQNLFSIMLFWFIWRKSNRKSMITYNPKLVWFNDILK